MFEQYYKCVAISKKTKKHTSVHYRMSKKMDTRTIGAKLSNKIKNTVEFDACLWATLETENEKEWLKTTMLCKRCGRTCDERLNCPNRFHDEGAGLQDKNGVAIENVYLPYNSDKSKLGCLFEPSSDK